MIDLSFLNTTLLPLGYQLNGDGEFPVFWKKINHDNPNDIYAFDVIMITLDTYTVTIEGLHERLIRKAIRAGVIVINSIEELDALRHVIYDDVLEIKTTFLTILNFLELQLNELAAHPFQSDEQVKALANLKLLVEAANNLDV